MDAILVGCCMGQCLPPRYEVQTIQCVIDGCHYQASATTPRKAALALFEHAAIVHRKGLRFERAQFPDRMVKPPSC